RVAPRDGPVEHHEVALRVAAEDRRPAPRQDPGLLPAHRLEPPGHRAASPSAASTAPALASVSRSSAAGTESATIPAPACTHARPPRKTAVRIAMAVSSVSAPQPT